MAFCTRYDGCTGETLTERHVQAIWYDRNLRPDGLVTRAGTPVVVLDPGTWNLGAGPDFQDAVLAIGAEGRRLRGDVEVHLTPADWSRHGHGTDPAYRRVIAHVTWGCGPDPATLPPGAVSIWLGRFMTANVGFSPEQVDLSAYPFARLPLAERPCERRLRDDPDLANAVLSAAGVHRLRLKARRVAGLLAARPGEREQVFYEEVMTALGYRRNVRGFRQVARTVPYACLAAEPENAESAMLGAAAFVEWNRLGLRPTNTPEVRIGAAATLFTRPETMALAEVSDFSPSGCRGIVGNLAKDGVMGKGRAAAIIANVIVPWALAEGRIGEVPHWLPGEDLSEPVRLAAFRIFGRDHHPAARYATNGLLIQGLIQIHRDHCLQVHPDCDACRLITEINKGDEHENY